MYGEDTGYNRCDCYYSGIIIIIKPINQIAFMGPFPHSTARYQSPPLTTYFHCGMGGTGLRIYFLGTSGTNYHFKYLCPVIIITSGKSV